MRLWLLLLVACGGSKDPAPIKRDAAPPADASLDANRCAAALRAHASVDALVDACAVCELPVLLAWHTPAADGGPPESVIARAMESCNAFCTGTSRERFLATLDEARGISSLTPWKQLAELCKDKVSSTPDTLRYAGSRWFALDRIARSVGAHGGPAADALAAADVSLPPLAIGGGALELPAAPGVPIPPGAAIVTVTATDTTVTHLAHAHLDKDGIHRVADELYPGKSQTDLAAALKDLGGTTFVVIAPRAMPAARLAEVLTKNPGVATWRLAVTPPDQPFDWKLPAMIDRDLTAADATGGTVQDVAASLTRRVSP